MNGERELMKAYESILGQHFEEAAEWFLRAIERDPGNPDYYYKLSITYARSGRLEEALEQARKSYALRPDRDDYAIQVRTLEARQLCLQAEQLLSQEKGREDDSLAAAYLQQAIRLDPLSEHAYMLLAAAYARMKEYKDAIQTLRELLALNPEQQWARAMLEQYKQQLTEYLEENE